MSPPPRDARSRSGSKPTRCASASGITRPFSRRGSSACRCCRRSIRRGIRGGVRGSCRPASGCTGGTTGPRGSETVRGHPSAAIARSTSFTSESGPARSTTQASLKTVSSVSPLRKRVRPTSRDESCQVSLTGRVQEHTRRGTQVRRSLWTWQNATFILCYRAENPSRTDTRRSRAFGMQSKRLHFRSAATSRKHRSASESRRNCRP